MDAYLLVQLPPRLVQCQSGDLVVIISELETIMGRTVIAIDIEKRCFSCSGSIRRPDASSDCG
ncbi:hypothetical protein EH244_19370 [Variovorax beijingensis]|uniref:Uncharacterized protein n=1 Tax=Variovorax beijingensis TaxID=2496117 RepID=A0A3P3EKM0_9BURK|nr:hypothetical protein [Variovorax beijingensis]RRH86771.1 hypothetical protein EH244_19370 [Variovorax beijingensis]